MSEYNVLYSSEIKDIVDVSDVNYRIEDDKIIFIANIQMVYNVFCHPYKIGSYEMNKGYGRIITENGIKEYKNLKSLCKATENFNPKMTFEYDKVLRRNKRYKNEK